MNQSEILRIVVVHNIDFQYIVYKLTNTPISTSWQKVKEVLNLITEDDLKQSIASSIDEFTDIEVVIYEGFQLKPTKKKINLIKRCPICYDREKDYGTPETIFDFNEEQNILYWEIRCPKCCHATGSYVNEQDAINEWNECGEDPLPNDRMIPNPT